LGTAGQKVSTKQAEMAAPPPSTQVMNPSLRANANAIRVAGVSAAAIVEP
jgi:hypothetical protein